MAWTPAVPLDTLLLMSVNISTSAGANAFADAWVRAWNSHDLDAIMSHYAEDATLVSPTAAALLGDPTGEVRGRAALRDYFRKGLEAYPKLRFEVLDIMVGVRSVVLCFINQKGTKTAEFMELNAAGEITRVVASYSA
jgi:ketosteroid isomerase-like protein